MKREAGFTLLEIAAVLVLVGILSAVAGFGIVQGVEGYVWAQNNAETTQKAQLALSRITRELRELSSINSASSNTVIIFTTPSGARTIGQNGSYIKWDDDDTVADGDILTDGVSATSGFGITYFDRSGVSQAASFFTNPQNLARVDLRLRLSRPEVATGYLEFTTSVVPRRTGTQNAPKG